MQSYGGKLFQGLQDIFDQVFCELPPPTPSLKGRGAVVLTPDGRMLVAQALPSSGGMGDYHDRTNPCFAGDCLVALAGGSVKKVRNLRVGDRVKTGGGGKDASDSTAASGGLPGAVPVLRRMGRACRPAWRPPSHPVASGSD